MTIGDLRQALRAYDEREQVYIWDYELETICDLEFHDREWQFAGESRVIPVIASAATAPQFRPKARGAGR